MTKPDINALFARARALADELETPIDGIDGRDGKDGEAGPPGPPGPEGPQGAAGPTGADGRDGRDGKDGTRGPRGPEGDIGPMPKHEIDGTKIRFEMAPDVWGEWMDIEGPRGKPGQDGRHGGGGVVIKPVPAKPSFSYMPAGW